MCAAFSFTEHFCVDFLLRFIQNLLVKKDAIGRNATKDFGILLMLCECVYKAIERKLIKLLLRLESHYQTLDFIKHILFELLKQRVRM